MKKIRILIVDDEPGIRESLSGVLEDEGYLCTALESAGWLKRYAEALLEDR